MHINPLELFSKPVPNEEVAERMGISQAAFAQLEAPDVRPRKSTLRRVAQALGIQLEQLDF